MASTGRVVIAGVATEWGSMLANSLVEDDRVTEIIGIDTVRPAEVSGPIEFIEADIRDPAITGILPALRPDVVVHCGIIWFPEEGRPSRALHDINVIGTLNLLAACERVEGLRAVVGRGSAAIYGSAPARPTFFTEEMAGRYPLVTRFQRDVSELEGYFGSFARRHPTVTCCMLRFQNEIGQDLDNPLSRYLSLPLVPVQLGFDPLLQLLHPVDANGALVAAVHGPVDGPVNVAPDGSISLSRLLRLCGKLSLPVPPGVSELLLRRMVGMLGTADLYRDGQLLLRYGRGCDNRRLREEIGYEPAFDTEGTAQDFASRRHGLAGLFPLPHPGSPVRSV